MRGKVKREWQKCVYVFAGFTACIAGLLLGQVLRTCFVCGLAQIITDNAIADTTNTHMIPTLVVIKVTGQPSDV